MSASLNCRAWKSFSARRTGCGSHVGLRGVEGELRAAQRTGGDVQPPAVQPGHGEAEALPLLADAIVGRHAAVEVDLRGRLGVPAHLALVGPEAEARRALLDHEGRDALGALAARAGHDHIEVRDPAARDEGLAAVEHIVVAVRLAVVRMLAASEPEPGSVRQ
jgi:hypothetical protein